MKAVIDAHYEDDKAHVACVVFENWQDCNPLELSRITMPVISPYRPGRFFERELPCLLAAIKGFRYKFDTIIIDGYVHLKKGIGKGLGTYLYESLPFPCIVIGVAKSPLKIADNFVAITRGGSKRPLFVSSIGCPADAAANAIISMHGNHRLPTLLKIADNIARGHFFNYRRLTQGDSLFNVL
ncbi:MAG TPA: endonuclease V [Syntrophorhabdaceae bacterium]|nr:endonuclease V [Syntrophorhabdaceae bacterium]HPP06744.1 endonuclease V [Syntrophorhabdaceae bacterium]